MTSRAKMPMPKRLRYYARVALFPILCFPQSQSGGQYGVIGVFLFLSFAFNSLFPTFCSLTASWGLVCPTQEFA
jgi:hypothetical protein